MPGVVADGEDNRRLDRDVQGQGQERGPDQPECGAPALLAGAGQLPEHDGARAEILDEAVQSEPGQGDGPGGGRGDRQDRDADDVPGEGDAFEVPAPAQEAGCGHEQMMPRRCGMAAAGGRWHRVRRSAKTLRRDGTNAKADDMSTATTQQQWAQVLVAAARPDAGPDRTALVRLAVGLGLTAAPGVTGCSVTELTGDGYRTAAAAGPVASALDQAQYDAGSGPCLVASGTGRKQRLDDADRQRATRSSPPPAGGTGCAARCPCRWSASCCRRR